MSDLKAQDYYNDMKEIVDVPDFTKLTSTGISPDYESIFDFAEAYFDARMEANGVTTGEKQCNLPVVNNLAKLAEFVKQQKDLPPEINDIINDNFWDLI